MLQFCPIFAETVLLSRDQFLTAMMQTVKILRKNITGCNICLIAFSLWCPAWALGL